MGGHHKKSLRAEKAKVKLKGAKLPKGLNVTKTDFKVKKIVIREQLRESEVENGRRKINAKELLSRLKHSNSQFRLEALRTIRESPNSYSDIFQHLGEIIRAIAAISLDIERETRQESINVLSGFLGGLPTETVEPFFPAISSYLRCAMTHIQPAIQDDSLLLLDAILLGVPELVAADSTKIFGNFLEMISKSRADAQPGRTLTVKMGNKVTSVKWRSKVLERLQGMLKALIENRRSRLTVATSEANSQYKVTNTFSTHSAQHFPIIRTHLSENCDLSAIFNKSIGEKSTVRSDESTTLRGYIEQLMPLLTESWLEVRPQESSSQAILSFDAAFTLKIILEILQNLWTLTEILEAEINNTDLSEWFRTTYAENFVTNFLGTFPYQQAKGSETKPKGNRGSQTTDSRTSTVTQVREAGGQHCLQQNLSLAYLMCVFHENKIDSNVKKCSEMLIFLREIVSEIKSIELENFVCLEKALRATLFLNGMSLLKYDEENIRALLRAVIFAARNDFIKGDGARKILILLSDIVLSPKTYNGYGPAEFETWLTVLPQQVLSKSTIHKKELVALSNLCKQENPVFLRALPRTLNDLINHMQAVRIVGSENAFEGKKLIMNLFFWIDISPDDKNQLMVKIDEVITDKRIAGYFKFIVAKEINVV